MMTMELSAEDQEQLLNASKRDLDQKQVLLQRLESYMELMRMELGLYR